MKRPLKAVPPLLVSFLAIPAAACADQVSNTPAVQPWMSAPFLLLLLSIALLPFVAGRWWRRNYPFVALGLGVITAASYVLVVGNGDRLLRTGFEYASFIVLIGSLFVVSGGIHIRIWGRSKPFANVAVLGIGALLANVLGTTGASMILIRPYIRVNRYRIRPYHIVFFIFIVSNLGGALTPIGDPPLFLGYLEGIPFFWAAENLWLKWLVGVVPILLAFYVIDLRHFKKLSQARQRSAGDAEEHGEFGGATNFVFLGVILIAAFVTRPLFVRELLMAGAAAGSYLTTRREIHAKNEFNFLPIKEVAILFAGIFITMVPALEWLERNAGTLGIHSPGQFYWSTGALSSVLDNAPTYLSFLSAAVGTFVSDDIIRNVLLLVERHGAPAMTLSGTDVPGAVSTFTMLLRHHGDLVAQGSVPLQFIQVSSLLANHALHVQAISLGAVFFGACTYIGNGPNFLVKTIAEHAGVSCPGFFGYVFRYTIPVLVPALAVVWFLFFRG